MGQQKNNMILTEAEEMIRKVLQANSGDHGCLKEFLFRKQKNAALSQIDVDINKLSADISRLELIRRILTEGTDFVPEGHIIGKWR